jgi:hypothetical protein
MTAMQPIAPKPVIKAKNLVPVSQEWRKEWRRNGAGLMTLATIAGAGYVSACQTFVVLSSGKLTHPSWWSWPFWICLILAVGGFYIFLAAYHDNFPFPGRERPIDHSMKYSLGLQEVRLNLIIWTPNSVEPGRVDARAGIVLINGTQDQFMRVYLEEMTVSIAGIAPESVVYSCREIRILPRNVKLFWSPSVSRIPRGDTIRGEISYTVVYGPPNGFPAYRRTHKVQFNTRNIFESDVIELGGIDWQDLETETDEDLPDGAPEIPESQIQTDVAPVPTADNTLLENGASEPEE